jgi:hypothetical protein
LLAAVSMTAAVAALAAAVASAAGRACTRASAVALVYGQVPERPLWS